MKIENFFTAATINVARGQQKIYGSFTNYKNANFSQLNLGLIIQHPIINGHYVPCDHDKQ